jgi:hypothetical protein
VIAGGTGSALLGKVSSRSRFGIRDLNAAIVHE